MKRQFLEGNTDDKREIFKLREAIGSAMNIEEAYEDHETIKVLAWASFQCTDEEKELDYKTTVIRALDIQTEETIYINTSSTYFVEPMTEILTDFPGEPIRILQCPSNKNKGKFFYKATLSDD